MFFVVSYVRGHSEHLLRAGFEKLYRQSEELNPTLLKSHLPSYTKLLAESGPWLQPQGGNVQSFTLSVQGQILKDVARCRSAAPWRKIRWLESWP